MQTVTKTDHKLVKATFKLDWWRLKQKHTPSERVSIKKLTEPATRQLYASELNDKTKTEQHSKYVCEWSLKNNFKNLQRICQRSLRNQGRKPETINIKGSARIITKIIEAKGWSKIQSKQTTKGVTWKGKELGNQETKKPSQIWKNCWTG